MPNHPQTEKLVRDYHEAMFVHDWEGVSACFTDDIVWEDIATGGRYDGRQEVMDFFAQTLSALGVRVHLHTVYATDEGYGIAWTFEGTHTSDLPGMPATGRSYAVRGASIAQVRDGLICYSADYWSLGQLMEQLGFAAEQTGPKPVPSEGKSDAKADEGGEDTAPPASPGTASDGSGN